MDPLTLWCELAWLGAGETQPSAGVLIETRGGRISGVQTGMASPPRGAAVLRGLTLPGLANAHSHCFQRALRGRTQAASGGSFWSWREQMYALAEAVREEEAFEPLARATFAEMARAGFTLVGEFDYIHHSEATVRAAAAAGVRLTLIDACYLHGGLPQFRDASAGAWVERMQALDAAGLFETDGPDGLGGPDGPGGLGLDRRAPGARPAAAIHSMRAVDAAAARSVAAFCTERGWPLHAHVSEQVRENEEVFAAHGKTPTALLASVGALSDRFTAVHATHVTENDTALMRDAGAYCCMCPTTERDLADGIGPVAGRLTLGSDSQSLIDPFEEARAVELNNRLATGVRGTFSADALATGLTANGYASLGWPEGGRIARGALADLTTVALDGVSLAGTDPARALDSVVFAGFAGDVREVIVGGNWVVRDGAHVSIDVEHELAEAIERVWA